MRVVPLLLALGCVPVEPSGSPLTPVRVTPVERPAAAPAAPDAPQGDFDFEAEDREEEGPADAAADPLELQARLLGVPVESLRKPAPAPEPAPAAPVAAGPAAPVWDPTVPLPDASFGIRILAVLLDIQPPRAVIGLPDGREQVVTPGAMLPTEGLVVLAIGRDAVQIAKVTPQGFYAKVETQTVRALYPGATSAGP